MNKGESIIIEQVGNGYVVSPGGVFSSTKEKLVFQTDKNLLTFIKQHFMEDENLQEFIKRRKDQSQNCGGPFRGPDGGFGWSGGGMKCDDTTTIGTGGGGLSPTDWAVRY